MPAPRFLTAVLSGSDELARIASAALAAVGVAASSVVRDARASVSTRMAELFQPDLHSPPTEAHAGPWTATRLKQILWQQLRGERVIVVANREPRIHEWAEDGTMAVRHPESGLVTALEPVMRACSGVWVAHGSGSADRNAADRHGRFQVQSADSSYLLRRVWLNEEEERGYYYGFSNEALWPLCHLAHATPTFRRDDWTQYQRINQRFADAVAAEADCDDPIVLVQDYHFALVPQMLRRRFPRATILTFWHVPWPNAERFSICPYPEALLDGLLGSSMIGFQTAPHCHNFLESVDRTLEARVEREDMVVIQHSRTTLVRAHPISIEWPNPWSASAPSAEECRRTLGAELGLSPDTRLIVSVDRLDYTKGIEERLRAFERILERRSPSSAPLALVLIAAPSRVQIDRYRELGDRVRAEVDRINEKFGADGRSRIVLLNRHYEPPEVFRLYRAADVCYVSSLHDGMNLVAKEFVAARDDERGVLVLSRFAGAARELTEALIVNPYDAESVAEVLELALGMPGTEQRERMHAMRAQVADHNVYRWAGRMLLDATRLRQRERLHGRLANHRPRRFARAART
jgi:trehalose 6-phosphate synthase